VSEPLLPSVGPSLGSTTTKPPRPQGPDGLAIPRVREYAESWVAEDAVLTAARARAVEMGVQPVEPLVGAALRFLAAITSANAVVELGTGTGVSGLWLLRGMAAGGVLTSIDTESEHQRLAKEAFAEAGIPASRLRLISGRAAEVLPRLADGGYDLVHADAEAEDVPDLLAGMARIVRVGGAIVISHALAGGTVADPMTRDAGALALRDAAKAIRDREDLVPLLLPIGDGILAAARTA
jgi:predicted O-methyltransferase YrrM